MYQPRDLMSRQICAKQPQRPLAKLPGCVSTKYSKTSQLDGKSESFAIPPKYMVRICTIQSTIRYLVATICLIVFTTARPNPQRNISGNTQPHIS